jgi:hypothetical protein
LLSIIPRPPGVDEDEAGADEAGAEAAIGTGVPAVVDVVVDVVDVVVEVGASAWCFFVGRFRRLPSLVP